MTTTPHPLPPPPLDPPERLLLGPGPSPVTRQVLDAFARPTLGHLDPHFLRAMDEVRAMLWPLFGARPGHGRVLALSATGSAGMEAALVNLLEPGQRALIAAHGVFGLRMAEVARRAGAQVTVVESEFTHAPDLERLQAEAQRSQYAVLGIVHAETSTGVLQDLAPLRAIADRAGALLVVDAVTSLGGLPVEVERHGVDACYSATQKCLSCPPGLAPLYLSPRALARTTARATPSQSWYLDLALLEGYWGSDRAYHHTAPIQMIYGLHEALRQVHLEGIDARFTRHRLAARALWAGLESMGLELGVPTARRLAPLTVVRVPEGVDEASVRRRMLEHHGIEIGGGLGALKGRVWRIGLMGAGATLSTVERCLTALGECLAAHGFTPRADGLHAARAAVA